MWVWPTVAVLGFLGLTGVVIALGRSSTARYEFQRNRVHQGEPAMPGPRPARATAGSRASGGRGGEGAGAARRAGAPVRERSSSPAAVDLATDPAGRRPAEAAPAARWWVVDGSADDGAAVRVLAGPFDDRLEADWATVAGNWSDAARPRVVHGVRQASGALLPRPASDERAWLTELGGQLTRLTEEWFDLVSDTDPLTTLVVEVAEALVEAGLPLHDCAGSGSAGGVCLTPFPPSGGILIGWRGHDRMSLQQIHGPEADAALRQTMTAAVADVLTRRGFAVAPLGWSGCHLVGAGPR